MQFKLQCTLKLRTDGDPIAVAEQVILVNFDENLNDQATVKFFDALREQMKEKYKNVIFSFFDVEFKDLPLK